MYMGFVVFGFIAEAFRQCQYVLEIIGNQKHGMPLIMVGFIQLALLYLDIAVV